MRRREFMVLAAVAVAWPTSADAQHSPPMRRVGVLMVPAERDPEGQIRVQAFRQTLQDLGWVEGQNIRIDYRWGAGDPDRARAGAAELLELTPDVFLANGTPATAALQRATQSRPVVFVVVTDPVGAGFVESQSRPGHNLTGFSTFEPEIGGKWLQLLKEVTPDVRYVAGILDPDFKGFAALWREIESLAPQLDIELTTLVLRERSDDIESAVGAFARKSGGGLIVLPTAINNSARTRIFSVAARHRLPAVYPFRHYARDGGLMAYGFDGLDLFRRSAAYIDRILKGQRAGDLPVQAPTQFELVINLQTAKALGINIPTGLLARADEVIE